MNSDTEASSYESIVWKSMSVLVASMAFWSKNVTSNFLKSIYFINCLTQNTVRMNESSREKSFKSLRCLLAESIPPDFTKRRFEMENYDTHETSLPSGIWSTCKPSFSFARGNFDRALNISNNFESQLLSGLRPSNACACRKKTCDRHASSSVTSTEIHKQVVSSCIRKLSDRRKTTTFRTIYKPLRLLSA